MKNIIYTLLLLLPVAGQSQDNNFDDGAFVYPTRLIELIGNTNKLIEQQRAYDQQMVRAIHSSKIQSANGIQQDIPREAYLSEYREKYKDSNKCTDIRFNQKLVDSIEKNCRADIVKTHCTNLHTNIKDRVGKKIIRMQEIERSIKTKQIELTGKVTNLKHFEDAFKEFLDSLNTFEKETLSAFNESLTENEDCSQKAENLLLENKCTNSYELVFNNNLDELTKNCSKNRFSKMITEFTEEMNDGAFYYQLKGVSRVHTESRKLEAALVPIIGWIRKEKKIVIDSIKTIQKTRSPARTNQKNALKLPQKLERSNS